MTPGEARCPNHPEMPALGNCQRCGTFFCAEDRLDVDLIAYCRPCGQRPDVDWIEAYRQSLLGKRDGWAWLFGVSAIGYLILGANIAATSAGPTRLLAIPGIFSAIACALFFFGKPIARPLILLSTVFWTAAQLWLFGPWTLPTSVLSGMFAIAALTTTRNRLFFRLDVSREKLKQDYDRLANNPLARNAFALGVLSVLVPFVAPLAIILGAFALRAVNPDARPPVGKRGHALAGLVLGVIGIAIGAMWLFVIRH